MPEIGEPAPDFTLPTQVPRERLTLSELRGKKVVLNWFVLAFTGG